MARILLVVGAIVVVIVATVTVAIALNKSAAKPFVTVSFAGYTNDSAGTRHAAFVVSNASPWTVARGAHHRIQLADDSGWTNATEGWFPTGGSFLRAGSTEVVTILPPARQRQWRLMLVTRKAENPVISIVPEIMLEAQKYGWPTHCQRVGHATVSDIVSE